MFPRGYIVSIAIAALLVAAAPLRAHELGIAKVMLDLSDNGRLLIEADAPGNTTLVTPHVPPHCRLLASEPISNSNARYRWLYACDTQALTSEDRISLPWPLEGIYLDQDDEGRFIDGTGGSIELRLNEVVAPTAGADTVTAYLWFGITHILSGWDHLAFVALLCLLARGMALVKLITAFTVGHSITLVLATLNVVHLPTAPTEASIALSIVFLAREVLRGATPGERYGLALAFGLLHGLGFAGALQDFGLSGGAVFLPLLAFNLGVEMGQLLFVAALTLLLMMMPRTIPEQSAFSAARATTLVAWFLGSLGAFWTIERVAGFITI